jgi:hypothetical protein
MKHHTMAASAPHRKHVAAHVEFFESGTAIRLTAACAIGLGALALLVGPVSAQSVQPPTSAVAPALRADERKGSDGHPMWTESLGQPSVYVQYARVEVGESRYQSAARNLRKAAGILAKRSTRTYGLDRRRLRLAVAALRLTARDVSAGAVSTSIQLDSVLNTTHSALSEHNPGQ